MSVSDGADELVAVVGMGVAVPGACGPGELWRAVNGTRDVFSEPGERFDLSSFWSQDPEETDRTYARRAGYLHDFRPHPVLVENEEKAGGPGRDQAVRWLTHALLQARDGIGIDPGYRCGAYVGAWPGGSQSLVESVLVETLGAAADDDRQRERIRSALLAHYRHAVPLARALAPDALVREVFSGLPERISESFVVDTACASSLYAVDLGSKALLAGECEIAYCGGVNVVDPTMAVMFAKLSGLSPQGRVRAFTGESDGTLFSDGAGVVALKTLRRAEEDGDPVLGVLLGFGGAADGRGRSISAPNPEGQRRAVQRARSVNAVTADQVDWIVAHGTGTPAGDGVESEVLAELGPDGGHLCSSNKPVFGHTGWSAGVLSLMHALLSLRNGWIPAQPGARRPDGREAGGRIRVPGRAVRFPSRPDGRRSVGVSAFGFGGTNAHLLVADRPDAEGLRSGPPVRQDSEELALVAWSAHLPGEPAGARVRDWLRGSAPPPDASFPVPYPAPPPAEVRMSGRTMPVVDPCQLMALQVASRFVAEHGELWADLRDTTGVIAAHTGMPRGLVGTALRCYAHDATSFLERSGDDPAFAHAAQYLAEARRRLPATTEDSQAGVLPNVIGSRVAARYDLHGPTLAVDSGRDGTLTALRVAQRYLRTGELDLALILAANGNGTAGNSVLAGLGPVPSGEGAFLLAVTTTRTAGQRGLPVLARLSFDTTSRDRSAPPPPDRSYLAADHAVGILRAVQSAALPARLPAHHHDTVLLVTSADGESPEETGRAPRTLTRRYRRELTAGPAPHTGGRPDRVLPRRGVVLLASAEAGAPIRHEIEDSDSLVLELPAQDDGKPSGTAFGRMLAAVDTAAPHLTVIGTPSADGLPRTLALHDALLLVTQRIWPRWQPESSLAVLLAGERGDRSAHPAAALFGGFVKSLRWERTGAVVLAVTADEPVTGDLLARVARERTARPLPPPVISYLQGRRWVEALVPAPLAAPTLPSDLPLSDDSVGVVTGGAGGIAQALLTALAEHTRPTLWLLGRTPAEPLPPELADLDETRPAAVRAALMRRIRADHPDASPQSVVARADALLKQRDVHRAVQALRSRYGDQRVKYAVCDLLDRDAVRETVAHVLRSEGRVDFVIHAAGRVTSTMLDRKRIGAFRATRDTKVLGHLHLKSALEAHPPSLWCNIGSYSGAAGAPGDTDYASGNAYLDAVAETATGHREFTVGFTMWRQTGMGADALFQEHVSREGLFTPISTEEGTRQFLEELAASARTGGSATYLGRTETDRLLLHMPGLVRDRAASRPAARLWPAWRTAPDGAANGSRKWAHPADPEQERHLFDHLVGGEPTVPATFILDMAAQAAEALVPGTFTTGFRDARFDTFIRPFSRRIPSPLRIDAQLTHRQTEGDEDRATVAVSIHSDTLGPDGLPRPGALRHFRTDVLLSRTPPDAPPPDRPRQKRPAGLAAARDPYASQEALVSLRGPFRNLSRCFLDGDLASGTWTPSLAGNPGLRTMTIPALLMCAVLRTSALRPPGAPHQPLYVPRSIGRVDLHTHGANDHDLLLRYGHGLTVSLDAKGTYRAVTPDGRLLLAMAGAELVDLAG
ncbi:beta-ketoacyl synthase N-terminal-like domain-containing protein [Streptomyces sp. NPDC049590]|uniref:beta-ketoacyl synthase N-terminal-like domain-containing protein n=1 Tax=Streptomyces sp. NPDC049590 TaxID=3154834 RepID=UPI0034219983